MFTNLRKKIKEFRLSLRQKITLALSAIAVTLLISSIISVLEYSRMSNYVSELIAENIRSINVAQQMANVSNAYNLEILTVIGDEKINSQPDFNQAVFMDYCDSLRASLQARNMQHLADSVEYSYSAYMLTSLELPKVLQSPFVDTRTWYFDRLQPVYNRLRSDIDKLSTAIYEELQRNSATFERGFYRSVIPSAVAIAVGLLLVLMLLFFILAYYVNPIYKMLAALSAYRSFGKNYTYTFDGDDQLVELNEGLRDLANENFQLRRRIKGLRDQHTAGQ
ncbi:MAG: hypothetical protein IJ652_06765 [Bacteroidales bacterium]|nr:hypothetical protein [Bacteroidales bacterium]